MSNEEVDRKRGLIGCLNGAATASPAQCEEVAQTRQVWRQSVRLTRRVMAAVVAVGSSAAAPVAVLAAITFEGEIAVALLQDALMARWQRQGGDALGKL